jgi:hypothetical protein
MVQAECRADAPVTARLGQRLTQDPHAGFPVHQRVVTLVVDREPASLETLDHVDLPAGAMSLEDRRVQVGDQRVQLLVGARGRQGEVVDVVPGVDILDLLPHRHSGPAEHGDAVERRSRFRAPVRLDDRASGVAAAAARGLEDQHRPHVAWIVHAFREEEHQV